MCCRLLVQRGAGARGQARHQAVTEGTGPAEVRGGQDLNGDHG